MEKSAETHARASGGFCPPASAGELKTTSPCRFAGPAHGLPPASSTSPAAFTPTTPGNIQVPAHGRPIILLREQSEQGLMDW
jgi:hypothetical protein